MLPNGVAHMMTHLFTQDELSAVCACCALESLATLELVRGCDPAAVKLIEPVDKAMSLAGDEDLFEDPGVVELLEPMDKARSRLPSRCSFNLDSNENRNCFSCAIKLPRGLRASLTAWLVFDSQPT